MIIGAVALMILPAQPVVLGTLVTEHRLAAGSVGMLATTELLLLALGAAVGPRLMRGSAFRLKVAGALAAVVAADFVMGWCVTIPVLFAIRGMAGLFEGLALSATIITLIGAARPDRLNGIFLAASTLPQVGLALLLPTVIVPFGGSNASFAVLGLLAAGGIVATLWLPPTAILDNEPADATPVRRWTAIVALGAVVVQNAATGGAWDHLQILADQYRHSAGVVAIAMAGCLALQIVGAMLAALFGAKLPYLRILVAGASLQAGLILVMASGRAVFPFVASTLAFGLLWNAASPFQVRMLIALDDSRRTAQAQSPATLVGLCMGPAICGSAIHPDDVTPAFGYAAVLMAAAAMVYIGILVAQHRRR